MRNGEFQPALTIEQRSERIHGVRSTCMAVASWFFRVRPWSVGRDLLRPIGDGRSRTFGEITGQTQAVRHQGLYFPYER
jgi:hypothetical protein